MFHGNPVILQDIVPFVRTRKIFFEIFCLVDIAKHLILVVSLMFGAVYDPDKCKIMDPFGGKKQRDSTAIIFNRSLGEKALVVNSVSLKIQF